MFLLRLDARRFSAAVWDTEDGPWRVWLLLREIRQGLLAAVIAALGGILSEVGAVMMVGGNIEGETRVLTTAILMRTRMGDFAQGMGIDLSALGFPDGTDTGTG